MWDVPPTYDAALKWFRARAPMTRDAWNALGEDARDQAFMVSGVAQLDLVTQVHKAVARAVANGTTLAAFKEAFMPSLEAAWAGTVDDPPWRVETIFRTNIQGAYAAGRHDQMTDPDVLAERPYWRFDGVADTRQTHICALCNDTILPADDPFWKDHHPPLHFNCRSALVSMSEDAAIEAGVTRKKPAVKVPEGFGATPRTEPWTPDRTDYPPKLWAEYERKVAAASPPSKSPTQPASAAPHLGD